jgi:hypothetical protein
MLNMTRDERQILFDSSRRFIGRLHDASWINA